VPANGTALSCGVDKFQNATNETSPTTKVLSFAPDLCLAMLIAPSSFRQLERLVRQRH